MSQFRKFLSEDDAATAVEYAVMLGLILLAIIGTIGALGSTTGGLWGTMDSDLQGAGLGQMP
ncbi:MAG: Flp family type IVb pilin [Planctomycetota bacterium]|nr:Flp family type IVb pilin [Planctomycetota bacterium]MDA1178862.1 Flp family type IVb pilin [Planctomycetota bacterium]